MCDTPVQRLNEANYCSGCQTGGRILADRTLSRLLKGDSRTLEELEACVSHVGTARAGEEITVRNRLTKVTQRRLLRFDVEIEAPAGIISTGTHQRLVVERSRLG